MKIQDTGKNIIVVLGRSHEIRSLLMVFVFLFMSSALFAQCPPVPLAGLWQFTEDDDATVADASIAGNDGTFVGDATLVDDPDRGIVGSFGGGGWVSIGQFVTELGDHDFSYACWLKTTQAGGVLISKQGDDAGWNLAEKKLYISPGGGDGGGSPPGGVSMVGHSTDWITAGNAALTVNDGEWHHVVMVFHRDRVNAQPGEIYIDGALVTNYAKQGFNGRPDNAGDLVYIGRTPGGENTQNLIGLLDDVAIFAIALNADEVLDVMAGDFEGFDTAVEFTPPTIEGAPESDSVVGDLGLMYSRQLQIAGCPGPDVVVASPEGATISATGLLLYDVELAQGDSFLVEVEATNEFAGGTTEVASWNVTILDPPPPPEGIEVAGALFVDLRAEDMAVGGEAFWENHGILDDFVAVGTPVVEEVVDVAAITFNTAGNAAYQSQEVAPLGLVGPDPTRTIEVWAYNPEIVAEETLVCWGRRGGPNGTNISFNYGNHVNWGAIGGWGNPDIGWTGGNQLGDPAPEATKQLPLAGVWHHLVYTFDGGGDYITRVYADGELVNAEGPLNPGVVNTHGNTRITVAAQNNNNPAGCGPDCTLDFSVRRGVLSIGQIRIHDGVLTAEQVLSNFEAEREVYGISDEIPPEFLNVPDQDVATPGTLYSRQITVRGRPEPTVTVIEPAGASISETGLLTYEVPDPAPESFVVTLEADNGVGDPVRASWTVMRAGLMGLWCLEEGEGLLAVDSVGDADAVLINMDESAWIEGEISENTLVFDGMDDYLLLAPDGEAPLDFHRDFTWAAWVNTTVGGTIFAKCPTLDVWARGAQALFIRNGQLAFDVGWVGVATATGIVADGQWHHVAVTVRFDVNGVNDEVQLFIDGAPDTLRSNWDIEMQGAPPGDFKAGFASSNFPATPYLNGALDELRIWDYALTMDEVLEVYEDPGAQCSGEPGPCGVSVECAVTDDVPPMLSVSVSISGAGSCDCETLEVTLDGEPLEDITVDTLSAVVPLPDPCAPGSEHTVAAKCTLGGEAGREATCTFTCPVPEGVPYIRGDANSDGSVNISDASYILNFLFLGGPDLECLQAGDANSDDTTNISDASYILNFLFLGGPDIGPPNVCAETPVAAPEKCASYSFCEQ